MSDFGKSKGGGRRAAARTVTPLVAVVTTLGGSRSAVLEDISSTGALVRGAELPGIGADIVLGVERVSAFGSIVRCDGNARGIEFDEPLSAGQERHLRQRVEQARGLPPEIKAALDDWMLGVAR